MSPSDEQKTDKNNTNTQESFGPLHQEWDRVTDILRQQIGDTAYRSWIRPLSFLKIEGFTLQIGTPTRFMRDWVQGHYADDILGLWAQEVKTVQNIEFLITADKPKVEKFDEEDISSDRVSFINPQTYTQQANENLSASGINTADISSLSSPLDTRFTFENFIVGKSNELAHAAARRVTETETVSFNPLYIHGGVGLGKTHLMHAIAWRIKTTQPHRKLVYLSAERFMYQFIRALRFKDAVTFKEQFRSVDVLMIDDIQFISGKESTQEEFFHTFNALMDQNKQIIVAADKSPSDLLGIDPRLQSRLGWGLVADIQPTSYDLRLGILHGKCEQLGANIPTKVLEFLAQKISSNVRELEGALNRVVAHSELVGRPVTIDYVQEVLQDLLRANNKRISIDDIQRKVVEHYGLRIADMQSARRARNVARPRQIAMYLAKQLTSRSLPEIGRKFGGRDHTTVMHAVRKIEELCAEDISFNEEIATIRRSLSERAN